MLVTRTPLRISLFGGGSDIPNFYNKSQIGVTLSAAINKYIYIAIQDVAPKHYKIMYSEVEQVSDVSMIKHELVKQCLMHFNHPGQVEIASFADIPTKGTGLGSSSSFTVGLIKGLLAQQNAVLSQSEIAELACFIEINKCNKLIGKQDQYAATFGGINRIEYTQNGVGVCPIEQDHAMLEQRLVLIYTGITRNADVVLTKQVQALEANDNKTVELTIMLRDQALLAAELLYHQQYDQLGLLLDEAWKIKREMTDNISSPDIDNLYNQIKNAGALGAKLLGAGAGGFILAYLPCDKNSKQAQSFMNTFGDRILPFTFDYEGSTLLFKNCNNDSTYSTYFNG